MLWIPGLLPPSGRVPPHLHPDSREAHIHNDQRAVAACEAKRRRRQLRARGSSMLSVDPTDPRTGRSTDPALRAEVARRKVP